MEDEDGVDGQADRSQAEEVVEHTEDERPWFRALYKEVADYDGQSVSQDVLAP